MMFGSLLTTVVPIESFLMLSLARIKLGNISASSAPLFELKHCFKSLKSQLRALAGRNDLSLQIQ